MVRIGFVLTKWQRWEGVGEKQEIVGLANKFGFPCPGMGEEA